MEKKTWLGKLIADLLETFKTKWPDFVASLWPRVPKELQEKVSIVIRVVENIKNFVDSPAADFITTVIPGDVDDKVKDWLRKVLSEWKVKQDYILNDPGHLHLLATHLTSDLTGLSFGQSAITTEVAYQAFKKEQKA